MPQRICDDVPAFTEGSTNLMFGITRKIFGVLAFSGNFHALLFPVCKCFFSCANSSSGSASKGPILYAFAHFRIHSSVISKSHLGKICLRGLPWAGILWSVAPNLVLFLFLYTAIGTWLTTSFFGKRLMQLTFTVLKKEGDLRFNLVRTRENSGKAQK